MEIKLDLNAGRLPAVGASKPAARATEAPGEKTDFRETAALQRALERTPDVRSDVVDQARRVVGEPDYPPRETLQKIATLLALQFKQD